jgi:DNA invertase Pin-like site-specific DNA recombinase
MMSKYVTYVRVSTKEQGKSGLGLEAQARDVELFLTGYSDVPHEVIASFQDIGSGADNGRPELQKAIAHAKKHNAELLVAKLDRLSRRLSYVANLMEDAKLKLRVASMPSADKTMLHVDALVAEMERDFISARTKAALQTAKARGTKVDGLRNDSENLANANAFRIKQTDDSARKVIGIIAPMREQNMSLPAIAYRLNDMQIDSTYWHPMKAKRAIDRGAVE